jgi:anti-sigma-K factor RskA
MPEPDLSDDDAIQAGELALGVLEGEERAAALRRSLAEPRFAQAVARWSHDLAPLLAGVAPVEPPAHVWDRIAQSIGGARESILLPLWRAVALVATLAAASLAFLLLTRPPRAVPVPVAPRELYVAQLAGKSADPLLVARYDPRTQRLRVRTLGLPQDGRRPELWVIAGSAAPRSLGLVALNAAGEARPSPELAAQLVPGVTLALTMEPATGAPHAAPSGTILGTATLLAI